MKYTIFFKQSKANNKKIDKCKKKINIFEIKKFYVNLKNRFL